MINLDKALGIHPDALVFRSKRAEMLANNLANVDTPGFKARDVDFRSLMQHVSDTKNSATMHTTNANHIDNGPSIFESQVKFRTPISTSLDGNTVDSQQEIAQYSENALRYSASLTFLNGRIQGIMTALRGE